MLHPDEADAFVDGMAKHRELWTRGPWTRSAKGNWYQRLANGVVLTIFHRRGKWHWAISQDGEVTYSPEGYPSQHGAQSAGHARFLYDLHKQVKRLEGA